MSFYAKYPISGGSASAGVASLNSLSGIVSIVGGSGISVSTLGQSIIIAATGSSLTFSDSLVNTAGTVTLVNDSATPGNSKYYGTDSGGVLGYHTVGTGSGSVTSVTFTGDGTVLSSTPSSAVTTSGTLTAALAVQAAHSFLAGPLTGGSVAPTFRAIDPTDVPTLNQSTTGTASNVTGTVAIAHGGTGQITQQLALNAIAGAVTSGYVLRGDGTNVSMSAIQAADVPTLNQSTTGTASNVTGTVTVPHGGTGNTSATAYAVLCGGTTSTSALQSVSGLGTAGQALTSNGASALPTWQAIPSASGTSTPTANTLSEWDSNLNFRANSFINGFATTVTSNGTTVLTVASAQLQLFTGSLNHYITLPVTSTLALGQTFIINNNSTAPGGISVSSSGGNFVGNIDPGNVSIFTCISTSGTTAASWTRQIMYGVGVGNINDNLPISQGGTGSDAFSNSYGLVAICNPAVDMVSLSLGTSGQVLTSQGAGAFPVWSSASAIPTFADSLVNTAGTVTLVNDSATPGNSKYYGTNSGGTLGYFSLPTASATHTPTANTISEWDGNKNFFANNFVSSITDNGDSVTLDITSTYFQRMIASSNTTVTLPVVTTLANGYSFAIINRVSGAGTLTIQTSGSNSLIVPPYGSTTIVTCVNTGGGTGTASWAASNAPFSNLTTTLGVANGGTGLTSTTPFGLVLGGSPSSTSPLQQIGLGTSGQYLMSNGAGAVPGWITLSLSGFNALNTTSIYGGTGNTLSFTGAGTSAIGYHSGLALTSGAYNSFYGSLSGSAITTGAYNTILGSYAGITSVSDSNNTFVGYYAGQVVNGGGDNVCLGYSAGSTVTTGNTNVLVGSKAGTGQTAGSTALTTGTGNVLLGYEADVYTAGTSNAVVVGSSAFAYNRSVVIGQGAYDEAGDNVVVGYESYIGSAYGSVAIGRQVTITSSGGECTAVGYGIILTGSAAGTVLGSGITVNNNNCVSLTPGGSGANNYSVTTANNQFTLGDNRSNSYISSMYLGQGAAPTTTPNNLSMQLTPASGSNITGSNLTIAPGNGTGTGGSGSILFQTAPVAASSSTPNVLNSALIINNAGQLQIGNSGSAAAPAIWWNDPVHSTIHGLFWDSGSQGIGISCAGHEDFLFEDNGRTPILFAGRVESRMASVGYYEAAGLQGISDSSAENGANLPLSLTTNGSNGTSSQPNYSVQLSAKATTNATPTQIGLYAIQNNKAVLIETRIIGLRTGGSAGSAGDAYSNVITGLYTNIAGTISLVGSQTTNEQKSNIGCSTSVTISGTNLLIMATGVVNNNYTWHCANVVQLIA